MISPHTSQSQFSGCTERLGNQTDLGVSLNREHKYWISERLMRLNFAAEYKICRGVMSPLWTSDKLCVHGLIFPMHEEINRLKHPPNSPTSKSTLLLLNRMKKHNTEHCIKFYKELHIGNKASSEPKP